ncbi:hypothetical protein CACET_c24560 [Clostridium aceticum]|uniref:Metal-binding protein n=1 Tax=Clostridium aceticum TaxID=84022 RepID=A0A0G3WB64_9CLOT|nr:DUF2284 domain-containing protein [Clostridium aceticum]AKL95901.1 hypothetical protein CACET_c24560 [Clostridium aceticum]
MEGIQSKVDGFFPKNKEIPVESIQIKEELRKLCEKNQCGYYNKNWTCPPAVGSLEEGEKRVKKYTKFILVYDVYELKSSFDLKGMMAGAKDFSDRLLKLKKEIGNSTNFMMLGAGGCRLCEKCAYIDGEECKRPEDAIISCEAHGIDVMSLMKQHGLKYNNGVNTVTYIGGVLHS